ncbi:MAG: hypothetical protein U0270_21760 [Labilithrix sp.]
MSLAKIQAPPLAQNVKETAESKKVEDARKVGQDFEAILVRQMLAQTNIGGKGGYADMATEALSSAVTKGGGLGLSKMIEQQLAPHHAESAAKTAAGTTPSAAVSAFKKVAPAEMKPISPAPGMVFSIPKK